jgi:hypothetical protein
MPDAPKKQLQVTVTVPRQCADAFSAAHAQGSQRAGNLPGTAVEFGIGASMYRPIRRAGYHLRVWMCLAGVLDQ